MAYIVGLTGGIGSGKSLIAELFRKLKVEIIDADMVSRDILEQEPYLLQKIVSHFGEELNLNGRLNRPLLREKIFNNEEEKNWLNQLLHPAIHREILQRLDRVKTNYALLVAPLLIENSLTVLCDRVLVVDVDPEIQLQRTIARDNNSAELVKKIMQAQVSRQTRLAAATDVIYNDLPLAQNQENLEQNVLKLHRTFMVLAQEKKNVRNL